MNYKKIGQNMSAYKKEGGRFRTYTCTSTCTCTCTCIIITSAHVGACVHGCTTCSCSCSTYFVNCHVVGMGVVILFTIFMMFWCVCLIDFKTSHIHVHVHVTYSRLGTSSRVKRTVQIRGQCERWWVQHGYPQIYVKY